MSKPKAIPLLSLNKRIEIIFGKKQFRRATENIQTQQTAIKPFDSSTFNRQTIFIFH